MLSESTRPHRRFRTRGRGWAIATLVACGCMAGCGPDAPDPSLAVKPKIAWRVVTLGVPPAQATAITAAVTAELQQRGLADIIVAEAGQVDHILEINVLRVVHSKLDASGAIVADETLREGHDTQLTQQGFFHVAPAVSDAPEKAFARATADKIQSAGAGADHASPAGAAGAERKIDQAQPAKPDTPSKQAPKS